MINTRKLHHIVECWTTTALVPGHVHGCLITVYEFRVDCFATSCYTRTGSLDVDCYEACCDIRTSRPTLTWTPKRLAQVSPSGIIDTGTIMLSYCTIVEKLPLKALLGSTPFCCQVQKYSQGVFACQNASS